VQTIYQPQCRAGLNSGRNKKRFELPGESFSRSCKASTAARACLCSLPGSAMFVAKEFYDGRENMFALCALRSKSFRERRTKRTHKRRKITHHGASRLFRPVGREYDNTCRTFFFTLVYTLESDPNVKAYMKIVNSQSANRDLQDCSVADHRRYPNPDGLFLLDHRLSPAIATWEEPISPGPTA